MITICIDEAICSVVMAHETYYPQAALQAHILLSPYPNEYYSGLAAVNENIFFIKRSSMVRADRFVPTVAPGLPDSEIRFSRQNNTSNRYHVVVSIVVHRETRVYSIY